MPVFCFLVACGKYRKKINVDSRGWCWNGDKEELIVKKIPTLRVDARRLTSSRILPGSYARSAEWEMDAASKLMSKHAASNLRALPWFYFHMTLAFLGLTFTNIPCHSSTSRKDQFIFWHLQEWIQSYRS